MDKFPRDGQARARPDVIIAAQKITAGALFLRKPVNRRSEEFVGRFSGGHDLPLWRKAFKLRGIDKRHRVIGRGGDGLACVARQHADDSMNAVKADSVRGRTARRFACLSGIDNRKLHGPTQDPARTVELVNRQATASLRRRRP